MISKQSISATSLLFILGTITTSSTELNTLLKNELWTTKTDSSSTTNTQYVKPPSPHPNNTTTTATATVTTSTLSSSDNNNAVDDNIILEGITRGDYGVDVSFPIHKNHITDSNRFKGKQKFYQDMIQRCSDHYGDRGHSCYETEYERIEMNSRQPPSMQNYTELGFQKIRAPPDVYEMLRNFWETNQNEQSLEEWPVGNTYTNHWDAPTHFVGIEDENLPGGGAKLRDAVWDIARTTIEEWTGERLTPSSIYGIRVYKEGSVLATHVDRLPLVSSAIINVAQDVDEAWPIEVYGHDGMAYNITMEPGDMVLYESHSILHGRPFPLKGRYYANIFIHFEPTGHTLRHEGGDERDVEVEFDDDEDWEYEEDDDEGLKLPPYIVRGSEEERRWLENNGLFDEDHRNEQDQLQEVDPEDNGGATLAHRAASLGELHILQDIANSYDKSILFAQDNNGWQPLHEAVRSAHIDVIEALLEYGADINAATEPDGVGGTILWWAENVHGKDHEVVKYLTLRGAKNVSPDNINRQ